MEKTVDYIQLINSENVGPITFYKLLEKYKSAKASLEALADFPKYKAFPRSSAEKEFEKAKSKGVQILCFDDPKYPEKLKEIEDAPPILYVLGNAELLNTPISLSVVGARNASINGRKTASKIAYDLTNSDVLIISGMARGIDSAAHKGAMHAQEQTGPTVAVLGTGIDVIYPSENKNLYNQIQEQGAIISEFPIGTEPNTGNFPRRNRIVSALSSGTLVVEATVNSGSLITARLALEQGKDIFAIPGSPQDARALGPNKLIKDGAVLAENAEDILRELAASNRQIIKQHKKSAIDKPITSVAIQEAIKFDTSDNIESLLTVAGIDVDELIRASGLDSAAVQMKLLELELNGKIERQLGNRVALIGKIK